MNTKLWYVGLEPYESRYTLQLTDWNVREFKRLGVDYEIVTPLMAVERDKSIGIGQVLDAVGRPVYAMGQIQSLLQLIASGKITQHDTIFFEDMFHPGLESLPYLMDQMKHGKPRVFVRCLAQTIDPDDFVNTTNMSRWMRHTEKAINEFVDGIFVASHEMLAHMGIAGWTARAAVTGLPFNAGEVQERVNVENLASLVKDSVWQGREYQVVFAARTDWEKQPEFFIELARYWRARHGGAVQFVIVAGKPLSSNSSSVLAAIRQAQDDGLIAVRDNLTKNDYYRILLESRVLFNCALQDWVSNTVSEADSLGCNVLYPAYRSFPETFFSDHTRLYTPWSVPDAAAKLETLLASPHANIGVISSYQSNTVARTLALMNDWPANSVVPTDVGSYRAQLTKLSWRTS